MNKVILSKNPAVAVEEWWLSLVVCVVDPEAFPKPAAAVPAMVLLMTDQRVKYVLVPDRFYLKFFVLIVTALETLFFLSNSLSPTKQK